MPVFGLPKQSKNPVFKDVLFTMFCPEFKAYLENPENRAKYDYFKEQANKRIRKSVFGSDWDMAMSYFIAFYLTEIVKSENQGSPSLSRLANNSNPEGRLDSYTVGSLSKSYNFDSVMMNTEDALFWNQNKWGVKLFALAKNHGTLSMAVAI